MGWFSDLFRRSSAPARPQLVIWDAAGTGHASRLAGLLRAEPACVGHDVIQVPVTGAARFGEADLQVVVWAADGTGDRAASHQLARLVQARILGERVVGARVVGAWTLGREARQQAVITRDEADQPRNQALNLMASGWPRLRERATNLEAATADFDRMTREVLAHLGSEGGLDDTGLVLLAQVSTLDRHGLQVLLTEPLADGIGWHGEDALVAAVRVRLAR